MSAAVLSPESSDSRMERMEDVAGPGAEVVAGADWTEETAVKRRRAGVGRRRWEMKRRWAWRGGGMAAAGGEVLRPTPADEEWEGEGARIGDWDGSVRRLDWSHVEREVIERRRITSGVTAGSLGEVYSQRIRLSSHIG